MEWETCGKGIAYFCKRAQKDQKACNEFLHLLERLGKKSRHIEPVLTTMNKPKEKAIGAQPTKKGEGQTDYAAGKELRKMVRSAQPAGTAEQEPKAQNEEDQIIGFTLRIWKSLDQEIKAHCKQLPARKRPNRNEFIQTAIEEKLQGDQKKISKQSLS